MKCRLLLGCLAALVFGTMVVSAADIATTSAPATAKAIEPADRPTPRLDKTGAPDAKLMKRHQDYVALAKKGGVDLYFLGDSITDGWHGKGKAVWDKEFAGWKPENFGIGGDKTQHVLWRLQNGELDGVAPKAFVLMIGTNNMPAGNTEKQIASGVHAILQEIQKKNPTAKILLLGIFPRGKDDAEPMPKSADTNALLAKFDDGKNIKYLDIGKVFLTPDGKITKEILPDGLHPNEKGYQLWADAIKPTLTEWLGKPNPPQNP